MDNDKCDCTDCVPLKDFKKLEKTVKKLQTEVNNNFARSARQAELDEKMLEMQRAVKTCEKNVSIAVSRMNGFGAEIAGVVKMVEVNNDVVISALDAIKTMLDVGTTQTTPSTPQIKIKVEKTKPSGESKLTPQSYQPSVTGTIETIPQVKEVETARGPTQITEFDFNIDGEVVKMALWEDTGKEVVFKKVGDKLTLTAISVKNEYDGKLQLSSTRKTVVK